MRIAHISDLHVLALAGAVPFRLFNKRATGYANLRFRRNHQHKSEIVRAIANHLSSSKIDHVVVTGDISNLALEAEFQAVRSVLDDVLRLPPSAVTLVPGNHDVYTRGAQKKRRFWQYFEPYLTSDLPQFSTEQPGGAFPIVKLRGPAAIIGLSTALARLPFVASGRLGLHQLQALEKILASPEVRKRTPVILLHHPLFHPTSWTRMKVRLEGLEDAAHLRELLAPLSRGLLLHGHLHRRIHHKLATRDGHVDVVGATSASLVHNSPARMAGYNLYDLAPDGSIAALESFAYDEADGDFRAAPLPGPGDEERAAS